MTLGVLPSILYFTVSWRSLSIQILQNFIVHHVPLIFANIEELCQPHILLHGGQVTVPYRFPQLVALSFWRKQFWHWQCWIWKQQYTNMMWPRERFMCIGIHAFHECDSCSCSGQCPASSHDIWSFGTIYAFWGLQCTWPISTYRKLISCPVCGEAQDGGHQLTSWWTQTYALWGRCYVVVLIFPTTSCFFVLDYNLCWRSKLDITDSILKPLAWLCHQYIWCFNINQII